jgi:hypothetical protein
MPFMPSYRKRPVRPSPKVSVVLAVGRRVFVHDALDPSRPVLFTDEYGKCPATARLPDGAEVEVLGWRPRGSAGTRYRVRNHADGADGWLGADELRTTAIRPPAEPAPAAAPVQAPSMASPRPFGRA